MEVSRPSSRTVRLAAATALALGVGAALRAFAEAPAPVDLPSAWKDGRLEVPRGLPSPWVPPSNPMTEEKIALGRRLFTDRAMSRDRSKACVDCHLPEHALTDGRATAVGVREQVGTRNVPSLWNAAIYPSLFWDGRAVSLEAQAEGPLLAPTELDMTEDLLVERIASDATYAPYFEKAFGTPTVTLRRIAYALSSFERTLLAADSPFDRWWFNRQENAMPAPARRGYLLFRTKGGCASCHSIRPAEASFSDYEFHATGTVSEGATDLGRFAVTGREDDRGRFRTPSLRNVARTGPYFHDGSAATLSDVLDHYDRGGKEVAGKKPEIGPLHLSAQEKADLLAFLEALSSPTVDATCVAKPAPAAGSSAAPAPGTR